MSPRLLRELRALVVRLGVVIPNLPEYDRGYRVGYRDCARYVIEAVESPERDEEE